MRAECLVGRSLAWVGPKFLEVLLDARVMGEMVGEDKVENAQEATVVVFQTPHVP